MFLNEELGLEERSKTLWERHYIFDGYKLNNFRAKHNRIKLETKVGLNSEFIRIILWFSCSPSKSISNR